MSDRDNLENLSGQLKQGAKQCSSTVQALRQQAQRLDWSAQALVSGVNAWAGQGARTLSCPGTSIISERNRQQLRWTLLRNR